MALEFKQTTAQKQQLRLSLRLQQAIGLLRLSHQELREYLDAQVLENPLLTRAETDTSALPPELPPSPNRGEEPRRLARQDHLLTSPGIVIEQTASYPVSLAEHLLSQLVDLDLDDAQRAIANGLLGEIGEDGYLVSSLEEIARELGVEVAEVDAVRCQIQTLDPVGCGSVGLVDCLQVQLHPDQRLAREILQLQASCEVPLSQGELSRRLGATRSDVASACHTLQSLDARPGSAFSVPVHHHLEIDLVLVPIGDGYGVFLVDGDLPQLTLSPEYERYLIAAGEREKRDPGLSRYLREKRRGAQWVLTSYHERQRLLLQVGETIVSHQIEFFQYGVQHLRPLKLRDVAEILGRDPSTISRLTTNKYIQTPRGTFELKYFFSGALESRAGEALAARAVQDKIRQLVGGEPPEKPLSDAALTTLLGRQGITIARRTVAKYREALGIAPARERRARRGAADSD